MRNDGSWLDLPTEQWLWKLYPAVIRHRAGIIRDARIVFGFWSGARDLNPGPHGPEI